MRLVTIAKPSDLDLAVPVLKVGKSEANLRQIMEGYSYYVPDWQYAANVEYRQGPNGPAIGVLAERGVVHNMGQLNWPVFWVSANGRAAIASNAHQTSIKEAAFAFSAGPILLREGQITDIEQEILRTDGLDSSIRPGLAVERAAIGIRPSDGVVIHIADSAASLAEVASALKLAGCTDAMALDGGGSVGVIDRQGRVQIGNAVRQVCSALVFRKVVETRLGDTTVPPSVPVVPSQGARVVCLDPGHGGRDRANRGPTGYIEADGVLDMALVAGQVLRSHDINVIYTRVEDKDLAGTIYSQTLDLQGRCDVANRAGANFFVSIHTNAGGGKGTETFYYPTSTKGQGLARTVHASVLQELGTYNRRIDEANFHVLRQTTMPAALVEVAFHDNREEEVMLKRSEFRARAGYAIAKGILDYLWGR